MITIRDSVTEVKCESHIQIFLDITTLTQKFDAASDSGFPISLQF